MDPLTKKERSMVENVDVDDVKSYYVNVTLNELCSNDSEYDVTVTFGKQLSDGRGKCDFFATNETRKIMPGETIMFFPPDGSPSLSNAEDYCYVANLSTDGNVVNSKHTHAQYNIMYHYQAKLPMVPLLYQMNFKTYVPLMSKPHY